MLNYLKAMPAQQAAVLGFSTALMEQGISAWPWRDDNQNYELAKNELAKIAQLIAKEKKDVSELQAYTDAELSDLGISKGLINHAVRHGRAGIDDVGIDKAA